MVAWQVRMRFDHVKRHFIRAQQKLQFVMSSVMLGKPNDAFHLDRIFSSREGPLGVALLDEAT